MDCRASRAPEVREVIRDPKVNGALKVQQAIEAREAEMVEWVLPGLKAIKVTLAWMGFLEYQAGTGIEDLPGRLACQRRQGAEAHRWRESKVSE